MLLLFQEFSYKRIYTSLIVLLTTLLMFSSPVSAVVSSTTPGETELEPGSTAAGFSQGAFSDASGPSPKNSSDKVKEIYKQDELLVKFKAGSVASERQKVHGKNGSNIIKEFKGLRIHHVKLKKGMTVEKAIELYRSNPLVEYAEPDYIVSPQATPNDPYFYSQWGLHNTSTGADIDAPAAWDITTGSRDVVIAKEIYKQDELR